MELLTVQETAKMLKVAPITVRRYIQSGRLPAVKVGRGVRLRREAIEAFLKPIGPGRRQDQPPVLEGKPLTFEDSLFKIIGIAGSADDDGPTDVSSNKHKYLAEAYADLHDN